MAKLTILLSIICLVSAITALPTFDSEISDEGKDWAVLVAGSKGWLNYRHQADVSHAYQIIRKNGIPDERVVVMMYDDIAHNEENPTPGKIINRPNGPNVYVNMLKDYTKYDVTAENFLNILLGNKDKVSGGSGKVLKSGPNDRVFINFVDHGAPGLVAFPDGIMTAKMLNKTITQMFERKMFKQLVFYLEACEAGSMFQNILPDNMKVYVTTASDPKHSSYACYYDKKRATYLGDVYSVNWMQNSDKANMKTETLIRQFDIVRNKTTTSKVCRYGDLSFDKEDLDDFQGEPTSKNPSKPFDPENLPPMDSVPAPDVPLVILRNRIVNAKSERERERYIKQIEDLVDLRARITRTMKSIVLEAVEKNQDLTDHIMDRQKHEIKDFDCLHSATELFSDKCYNLGQNEFALRMIYALVNMCEMEEVSSSKIQSAINKVCRKL